MADFTGNQIRHTYQRLLQLDDRFGSRYTVQDGTGSLDLDYFNLSGSINLTGSQTITGNLTVTDSIRAKQFIVSTISSSILTQTGSTSFGDTLDDTHTFTGSIYVTGGIDLTGDFIQLGNYSLTGNITQTGDYLQIGDLTRVGDASTTGSIRHTGSAYVEGQYEITQGVYGAFFANPQTISISSRIPDRYNSRMFGPITVAEGITLTVGANAKLEIIDI